MMNSYPTGLSYSRFSVFPSALQDVWDQMLGCCGRNLVRSEYPVGASPRASLLQRVEAVSIDRAVCGDPSSGRTDPAYWGTGQGPATRHRSQHEVEHFGQALTSDQICIPQYAVGRILAVGVVPVISPEDWFSGQARHRAHESAELLSCVQDRRIHTIAERNVCMPP